MKARTYIPPVYSDERGYFKEACNNFPDFKPVQANQSKSKKGVIRGLHYQKDTAKLVWVAHGSILDVALDPETGEHISAYLSADNHVQMYVPPNYAHGFQALEDDTVVCYLMDKSYNKETEGGYNPEFIDWPLKDYIISDKDRDADRFLSKRS